MAAVLGRSPHLRGRQRRPAPGRGPRLLRAVHVPVPVGAGAHGPRAQLHLRRPAHPLPHDAGRRRALADGVRQLRAAGRERGDQDRRPPPRVHRRPHRGAAQLDHPHRRRLRLASRGAQPRPQLHPLDAVDLPALARGRPRLPGHGAGQLVPRLPDGAGQRAGRRRPVRALGRPGREARPRAVVLPHHRLRPAAARRPRPRRLARAGRHPAAQLDRSVRGCGVRDGRLRRGRHAASPTTCASTCSPPAPTPASA